MRRLEYDRRVEAIDPRVNIGHVHLKVSDLDRALDFYCAVLGFELQLRHLDEAAFISAGGYHHHIGLNTWESKGAGPPPPHSTGLFHSAIRFPDVSSAAIERSPTSMVASSAGPVRSPSDMCQQDSARDQTTQRSDDDA